jgi:hypothetical protein
MDYDRLAMNLQTDENENGGAGGADGADADAKPRAID